MAAKAGFIFDMDGVLVDSMPFHVEAWVQVLGQQGVQKTREEFLHDLAGKTNRHILRRWFGPGLGEADMAALEARKETLYRKLYRPALKPLDGVLDFLAAASRLGISMAVATAAGRENRDFVLGGLGLQPYFRTAVGPEEIPEGKPDPGMFLRAAEHLGVPPSRCLVFEDALAGVEAATRAGMKAVALTTSRAASEFDAWPAVVQTARDFTALRPEALLSALSS
jgi:beta-phosphoglucomutase family hydrolase